MRQTFKFSLLGAACAGLAFAMAANAGSAITPRIGNDSQPIILAQAAPVADLDQLKSRGATIIDDSKIKRLIDCGRVVKGGIACAGAGQCLALLDNFGTQCTSFVCGNDHGTPVCWCDT